MFPEHGGYGSPATFLLPSFARRYVAPRTGSDESTFFSPPVIPNNRWSEISCYHPPLTPPNPFSFMLASRETFFPFKTKSSLFFSSAPWGKADTLFYLVCALYFGNLSPLSPPLVNREGCPPSDINFIKIRLAVVQSTTACHVPFHVAPAETFL